MELVALLAVPTLTSIIAPIVIEMVTRNMDKRKERRAAIAQADAYNDEVASQIRNELRSDNKGLREENRELREVISELEPKATLAKVAQAEKEEWKKRYYAARKENQALEFELNLLRQEVEQLRRQYEEYAELRRRAGEQYDEHSR